MPCRFRQRVVNAAEPDLHVPYSITTPQPHRHEVVVLQPTDRLCRWRHRPTTLSSRSCRIGRGQARRARAEAVRRRHFGRPRTMISGQEGLISVLHIRRIWGQSQPERQWANLHRAAARPMPRSRYFGHQRVQFLVRAKGAGSCGAGSAVGQQS